jgi:hypothetical protein
MAKKTLSLEHAAREWLELKAREEATEERLKELKAVLEPALRSAPGQAMKLAGKRFKLSEFPRESFQLARAKEKIDGRVLAPYITTTDVVTIRTSGRGGGEA